MLAKDLSAEERVAYMEVVRKHSALFISDYEHITGVTAVQHHINLKDGARLVVQRATAVGDSSTKCSTH